MKQILVTVATALSLFVVPVAIADSPVVLRAVGTWGNLTNYQKHECPFFNERLAVASGGQIIGEIKPYTELGSRALKLCIW